MKQRNEHLRNARQRHALTTGQFADAVADHIQARTGRRPAIDADYVSRLERGLISWPNSEYRAAFRSILRARADADLGFRCQRGGRPTVQTTAPLNAPTDLLRAAGSATLGVLNGAPLTAGTPGPGRIHSNDVADLHHLCDTVERSDHATGGGTLWRRVALDRLHAIHGTTRTASYRRPEIRTAWLSAVARLGRLAGFMSADAGQHDVARRVYLAALQIAATANDWPVRVNILAGMARQAIQIGDGRTALSLASLARAGEDDASATTQAMLHVVKARAYGLLREPDKALTAVSRAEDLFADRDPSADPPWLWYYDAAQLAGDTGHALWPLAMRGTIDIALCADRLTRAVRLHDPADTRGRAFSLAKLATLQVRYRPDAEAYTVAAEAIDAVRGLRSGRARADLRTLGRTLRRIDDDRARELAGAARNALRADE